VFLDTNVLVSAFASRGLCADLFELVLLEHDLVLGRNVLRELSKALRGKVKLSTARTTESVDFVVGEAVQVVEKVDPAEVTVDADDALVLGEVIAGKAQIFVTGDVALLGLGGIGALLVVSPRRFWEILHSTER
jgi:putative PIN family toxin of toxin-antitoxin system